MPSDWIDREHADRQSGINRPLLQSEHAEVNARYEGCTLERCCDCGEPTGRAGKADDSLFLDDDGPYCIECYTARRDAEANDEWNQEHSGEGW